MRNLGSAHNIILPDGTQTAPEQVVVAESGCCRAALRVLEAEFGPGPHPEVSVADLGCGEGGYAVEFARAGYDVTGIEARQENYADAVRVRDVLGLPGLRFILGDARDVLPGMRFDAVFCCGLLYHLGRPAAFLGLTGQVTRRLLILLILNTHFSMPGGHPESVHLPTSTWCDPGLSRNEGRAGHWCHEEDDRWASYGNTDSFWLCKDDLLASITAAGFSRVTELHDWRSWPHPMPWGSGGPTADRGMFAAYKA